MPFLKESYQELKSTLKDVALVAVSKTKPAEDIVEAYEEGQLDFGENYVQELMTKQEALPKDIRWHFIGHLQTNKVKYIAPFVYLIHSVDSLKLLKEIEKQATKLNKKIKCLLQVHISNEETKFGLEASELEQIDNSAYPHVEIMGLMGMASFTDDQSQVREEFRQLHRMYQLFQNSHPERKILSMGMSGDFQIAVEEGSNMIRVGSLIFGERKKNA